MARIAIHGFGRIGRSLMRVALKDKLFVPVSISDIRDVPTLAALFDVDSNYGRWPEEVTSKDSCFVVGGRQIPYFDSTKALPDWKALGVDLVIDCTGRATTRPGAQAHLDVPGVDRPADEGSPRLMGRNREHHSFFIRRRARSPSSGRASTSRARPTVSPHAPAASRS
jgi:Glyceraldehyde 3-phosphate dehydrogenase, NAD binding domain